MTLLLVACHTCHTLWYLVALWYHVTLATLFGTVLHLSHSLMPCHTCHTFGTLLHLPHTLVPCVTLWYRVSRFGTLCHPLVPCHLFGTLCHAVVPCHTVWYLVSRFGTLSYYLVPCVTLWYLVTLFGTLCHALVPCYILWHPRPEVTYAVDGTLKSRN